MKPLYPSGGEMSICGFRKLWDKMKYLYVHPAQSLIICEQSTKKESYAVLRCKFLHGNRHFSSAHLSFIQFSVLSSFRELFVKNMEKHGHSHFLSRSQSLAQGKGQGGGK